MNSSRTRRPRLTAGTLVAVMGVVGVLVTILAFARDLSDWRLPSTSPSPTLQDDPLVPGISSATSGLATNATTTPTARRQVNLDTLLVEAGQAGLSQLPPVMKDDPAFARSIVIKCPSNEGSDRQTDVSYRLSRRYASLAATIHPHFALSEDRDGVVHVYVLGTVRERDGTTTETTRGSSFEARMGVPAELTAEMTGADGLTLRVRCEFPTGSVVFAPATLDVLQ